MIHFVRSTRSTNEDMKVFAAAGHPEGTWLLAETQTGGRGRQGRRWVSCAGNLYASTLIRLAPADPPAPTLALVAGVALEEVVNACLRDPIDLRLKWPNDLLLVEAKLAGILLEREENAVIAGFGVNLASAPDLEDRAAASLASAGVRIDPADLVVELAAALARWIGIWRAQGLDPVRRRWIARAHGPGTPLAARAADGARIEGLFAGLDEQGALRLATPAGERLISAGDVFLI